LVVYGLDIPCDQSAQSDSERNQPLIHHRCPIQRGSSVVKLCLHLLLVSLLTVHGAKYPFSDKLSQHVTRVPLELLYVFIPVIYFVLLPILSMATGVKTVSEYCLLSV